MTKRICSVSDCDNRHYAKGFCNRHWARWRRNGDPLVTAPRGPAPKPRLIVKEKRCSRCALTLPVADFHKKTASRDGLSSWCRRCTSAKDRAYASANASANRARASAWAAANPERAAERYRAYAVVHRDKKRQAAREWRLANPAATVEQDARRRMRVAATTIGPIDLDALWTGACALCGEGMDRSIPWPDSLSKSIDHILPLAKGGTHEQANLQWTHLVCNIRKGVRPDLPSAPKQRDGEPDQADKSED